MVCSGPDRAFDEHDTSFLPLITSVCVPLRSQQAASLSEALRRLEGKGEVEYGLGRESRHRRTADVLDLSDETA